MSRKPAGGHVRTLGGETEYRLIRVDGKQRLEHRVVMEKVRGRRLRREEVVHHKDGNGLNNIPENLEILSQAEHRRLHGGPRKWLITLEEAIRRRDKGETLEQIAKVAGVSWSAIRSVFSRRGIRTSDSRHGSNKWNVEQALRRRIEGWTLAAIAAEAGVSGPSVRKAFIKRGVSPVVLR